MRVLPQDRSSASKFRWLKWRCRKQLQLLARAEQIAGDERTQSDRVLCSSQLAVRTDARDNFVRVHYELYLDLETNQWFCVRLIFNHEDLVNSKTVCQTDREFWERLAKLAPEEILNTQWVFLS